MKASLFLLFGNILFTGTAGAQALLLPTVEPEQSIAADSVKKHVLPQDSLKQPPAPVAAPVKDTTSRVASGKPKKIKAVYQPQIRILADVGNFTLNYIDARRKDYEVAIDYHYKNNWYFVAEGGYAEGIIDYDNLKYTTNSGYLRIGGDKSLLEPISKRDLDIVFFGFRYGIASGTRGDAYYVVPSQFGPSKEGIFEKQDFFVHWGEMTAGIRTELWKGIYAGWNFRARFLLNSKTFEQKLTPNYIAGYGQADKSTSFGFNIYLGYAFRWQRKS